MIRFRRLRRVAAVAAQLLLLQLVITGGAGACPLGDGMAQATEARIGAGSAHPAHPAMHGAPLHAPHATADRGTSGIPGPLSQHHHAAAHCDMPCTPAGCGSAGHCPTAPASSSAAPAPVLTDGGGGHVAARGRAPHSVRTAPEPPPPRA